MMLSILDTALFDWAISSGAHILREPKYKAKIRVMRDQQNRKHRRSRINKKWAKKYGYKQQDEILT